MDYSIEARARTLSGRIILGAREGYDGDREFSLEELANFLREANKEIESIPCIIAPGLLVGRSGNSDYSERVFYLNFSQSPRTARPLLSKRFMDILIEYGNFLGNSMKQERVYIDFNGETIVLRRNGH
jgi:hypothetical protein